MGPGLDIQLTNIEPGGHLCLFYEKEPAEQLPALIPFIRDGLARNEQFLYIADDQTVEQLSQHLQKAGIDVEVEKVSGRLKLYTRKEWRQPGDFDLSKKAAQVRELVAQAAWGGFKGIRFAVEMTWTLGPDIDPARLEHWEAMLNTLFDPTFPVRIVCLYNRSRLEPRVLMAALHTHPHAVIGTAVYPNPYFQAPLIIDNDGQSPVAAGTSSHAKVNWMINQLEAAHQSETTIAGQLSGMTRLHILSNRLASTREFDSTMQAILESIVELHGTDRGMLLLYDDEKGALVPSALANFTDADLKTFVEMETPQGPSRTAYTERRRTIVPDVEVGPFSAEYKEFARKAGFRAVHSTPILNRDGNPLGVLTVHFPYSCRPTPQQMQFTDMHARQAADFIERYRAEEELRSSKEHLRAIVENTPECIKIVSPEGTVLDMNPAGCRMLGAAHVWDVLGKCVYDIIAPEDRERYKAMHQRVCAGHGENIAFQIIDLNGSRHFMESHAVPLRDPQTGKLNLLATTRDVTAQKTSQAAQQLLAAIVESSDDAIIAKDLTGVITSWNKGAERLFGYTAREAIGRSITMLIPIERLDEEKDILARLARGESIQHLETVRCRKDGSVLNISLTISPVRNAEGKVIGASKIARDITERKRSEEALRESEARFRALIDNSFLPIWVKDCKGAYLQVNKHFEAMFGVREQDILGKTDLELFSADFARQFWENDLRVLRSGNPSQVEETVPQTNGEHTYLSIKFPLRKMDGSIYAIAGLATDITERKHAVDELRHAQEHLASANAELEKRVQERTASLREVVAQMEEFSYTVSHDLRAPVRAMKGYAAAALEDFGEQVGERGREYLNRIVRGSVRMENLIHDVLTYSRVARAENKLQPVSLQKLVQDIIQQYPAMQPAQADISIREPLPSVLAHEPSLMQAISNLMSNGIKFVAPGTKPALQIWTETRDGKVRLSIKDNGIGIKPEYQHRLFGMFERLHQNSQYEGTGIGLAIVRKAMDKMGGQAGLESDGVNGTCFWIELPAAEPA